jgi:hypothetical protein
MKKIMSIVCLFWGIAADAILVNLYHYKCITTDIYLFSDAHVAESFTDRKPLEEQIAVFTGAEGFFERLDRQGAPFTVFIEGDSETAKGEGQKDDLLIVLHKNIPWKKYTKCTFEDETPLLLQFPTIKVFLDAVQFIETIREGAEKTNLEFSDKDYRKIVLPKVQEKLKGHSIEKLTEELKNMQLLYTQLRERQTNPKTEPLAPANLTLAQMVLPLSTDGLEKTDFIDEVKKIYNHYRNVIIFQLIRKRCEKKVPKLFVFAGAAHIGSFLRPLSKACHLIKEYIKQDLTKLSKEVHKNIANKRLTPKNFPVISKRELEAFLTRSWWEWALQLVSPYKNYFTPKYLLPTAAASVLGAASYWWWKSRAKRTPMGGVSEPTVLAAETV